MRAHAERDLGAARPRRRAARRRARRDAARTARARGRARRRAGRARRRGRPHRATSPTRCRSTSSPSCSTCRSAIARRFAGLVARGRARHGPLLLARRGRPRACRSCTPTSSSWSQERRGSGGDDLDPPPARPPSIAATASASSRWSRCAPRWCSAATRPRSTCSATACSRCCATPRSSSACAPRPSAIDDRGRGAAALRQPGAVHLAHGAASTSTWRGKTIRAGDAVLGRRSVRPTAIPTCSPRPIVSISRAHARIRTSRSASAPTSAPARSSRRIEARAALPALLRRFPRLRLGGSPPVRRPTAVLRAWSGCRSSVAGQILPHAEGGSSCGRAARASGKAASKSRGARNSPAGSAGGSPAAHLPSQRPNPFPRENHLDSTPRTQLATRFCPGLRSGMGKCTISLGDVQP